jgi:predicted secreted protein
MKEYFQMQQRRPEKKRRALLQCGAGTVLLQLMGASWAQMQPNAVPPAMLLTELFKANTLDTSLMKLQPPVNAKQVLKSDYLLLDAPDIVLAGPVPIRMMSEIPSTDLFMLFDKNPQPGQPALLAAMIIPAFTMADISIPLTMTANTELLMLARANGRVFSASREVKLALKDRK